MTSLYAELLLRGRMARTTRGLPVKRSFSLPGVGRRRRSLSFHSFSRPRRTRTISTTYQRLDAYHALWLSEDEQNHWSIVFTAESPTTVRQSRRTRFVPYFGTCNWPWRKRVNALRSMQRSWRKKTCYREFLLRDDQRA